MSVIPVTDAIFAGGMLALEHGHHIKKHKYYGEFDSVSFKVITHQRGSPPEMVALSMYVAYGKNLVKHRLCFVAV